MIHLQTEQSVVSTTDWWIKAISCVIDSDCLSIPFLNWFHISYN